jgi:hypothetical protein
MPTYKVGFPYICVEAPDEKAALAAYDQFMEGWGAHDGFGPTATVVEDVPDYAVDAEGYEIEEDGGSPPLHGCTPSEKHPGLCAECGEPMEYPVKGESEEV